MFVISPFALSVYFLQVAIYGFNGEKNQQLLLPGTDSVFDFFCCINIPIVNVFERG